MEIQMIYVQGGTFVMVEHLRKGESREHQVTLSTYQIGKYQVTQAEWREIMGTNPSYFKGDNLPVERVNLNDVQVFIEKLNAKTGKTYRLPTEAEWEYAARGGNQSKGYEYSGSNNLDDVAWHDINSGGGTHPVGTKQANELGLYDMSGNVSEWCSDWYDTYPTEAQTNPKGAEKGTYRVVRGGAWDTENLNDLCVEVRSLNHPADSDDSTGFRLVRS